VRSQLIARHVAISAPGAFVVAMPKGTFIKTME
jgi:hypothetical protein